MIRTVTKNVLWSSCPSAWLIAELAKSSPLMVANVSVECTGYEREIPRSVRVVSCPMPDFYFKSHEEITYKVLEPARKWIKDGGRVLVHCLGGIGRSGTVVAMLLVYALGYNPDDALRMVRALGGGPQSTIQLNGFWWFARALTLIGRSGILELYREGARYDFGWGVDHASTVANVALDILVTLSPVIKVSEEALAATYVAGILHDIGRVESEEKHHEIGAREVLRSEVVGSITDPELVSRLVYHHRARTNPSEDEVLTRHGKEALVSAAALRLADSYFNVYYGEEVYEGAELVGRTLVIRGHFYDPIRFERKATFFEEATGVKVRVVPP